MDGTDGIELKTVRSIGQGDQFNHFKVVLNNPDSDTPELVTVAPDDELKILHFTPAPDTVENNPIVRALTPLAANRSTRNAITQIVDPNGNENPFKKMIDWFDVND